MYRDNPFESISNSVKIATLVLPSILSVTIYISLFCRNSEYYGNESMITAENNAVHQAGPNPGSYDLPSASQTEALKQENADVAHGNQYNFPSSTPGSGYSFESTHLLNPGFPQSQTLTQMPNAAPFSNVMVRSLYQYLYFFYS